MPGAPTAAAALSRNGGAKVTWAAPSSDGGSVITKFTVTASPGGAIATTTGTGVLVTGLTNGTTYTFAVTATNVIGTGPASAASNAVQPRPATYPAAVTDLVVTAGNAQVKVDWKMPLDDGGDDITTAGIQVYRVSDATSRYVYVAAPATTATIGQLVVGAVYRLRVYVVNRSNYGGYSAISADFTPRAGPQPAPPAGVTAQPGTGQARVEWAAPVEDGGSPVTGYVITTYDSANAVVGTPMVVAATPRSATVTGLANGTKYYFGVAATNSAGTGPAWYSAYTTPAAAPGPPAAVTSYPANKGIFVTWSAPADNGGSAVTSYVVTARGPAGDTSQAVTAQNALFSGLDNERAYTFSVKAANVVTTGAGTAFAASATPKSTYRKPTGRPQLGPAVQVPPPGSLYAEERHTPTISGDGRYVFYRTYAALLTPSGVVQRVTENSWTRYDTATGEKRVVWNYDTTNMTMPTRYVHGVASYDGNTFASYGGNSLYVWRADTGRATLASANAAGTPTAGLVAPPALTKDGRYLVFEVHDNLDMADHHTCVESIPWAPKVARADLYRFDTRENRLIRVPLNMTGLPNATPQCAAPSEWLTKPGVSADGRRIVSLVGFSAISNGSPQLKGRELVRTDLAENGTTATSVWMAPTPQNGDWSPSQVGLSDDGKTAVAEMTLAFPERNERKLYKLDPDAPLAAPIQFVNSEAILEWNISGDGKSLGATLARVEAPYTPQSLVVDIASGRITVASQVNGALAEPWLFESGTYISSAVDSTARKIVFGTMSANMLGRTDCATSFRATGARGCSSNIAVVDVLTGAVGVIPERTLGCTCTTSLGGGAPLQTFAGTGVNTATGSYTTTVRDAVVPGVGLTFDFRRTYNSAGQGAAGGSIAAPTTGMLGSGWSDPYSASLSFAPNGDVTVTAEDGAKAVFVKRADGSYVPPPGVLSSLASAADAGGGYTLTFPDSRVDRFDPTGRLTTLFDRNGRGLTLGYTGSTLTTATDSGGRRVDFEHDPASGRLTKLTMPDGRATLYGYDPAGRLTTVRDPAGATTTYAYNADNRLTSVTDPLGNIQVRNAYEPSGRVIDQTQPGGAQPHIAWDPANEVATTTDVDGRTSKDYYVDNVLIGHTSADGGTTRYVYDERLNLAGITDPNGNTTSMTYDAAGNLLTRTAPYPLSHVESWTYDADRNVLTYTNGRGGVTTNTYDSAHRVVSSTDPSGGTTRLTYTPGGQVATVADATGNVFGNTYDPAGNLVTKTDPLGNRTTFTYDAAARLLTSVDPRGNAPGADPGAFTTTYTYDAAGRVKTSTDPNGHTTTTSYDAAGNPTALRDPLGNTHTRAYDAFNRPISQTDPNGGVTTTVHNLQGEVVSVTDPAGGRASYRYDASGRLVSSTTPRGNVPGADPAAFTTNYAYDANGNVLATTDPLGNITRTVVDVLDRPVATIDPLGRRSTATFDADGNLVKSTDADGKDTTYTYDAAGRLRTQTDPTGATSTRDYDVEGRELRETSGLGNVTSWTYSANGQVLTATDPRGNVPGADKPAFTTTRAYDPAGNLLTITDPLGHRTSYTYDGSGLLTAITDPAGGVTTTAYDAADRPIAGTDPNGHKTTSEFDPAGRVLAVVDPLGNRATHTYDAAGRRVSTTTPRGNTPGATPAVHTFRFGYDPDGHRTTTTEPTGAVTRTGYDANGRPTTVTDALSHTTTTTYDAVGNVVETRSPGGAAVTSTYDRNNRLATVTDQVGKTTTYGRDPLGRALTRKDPSGAITSWRYDLDGRTVGSTDPRGNASGADPARYTSTFGYDPAGNRNTETDPLGGVTATFYDGADRKTRVTDPNGRNTTYTYDAVNRPISVTDPAGATTTSGYDPVGNLLTRRDANDHTTTYTYDAADRMSKETDPLGRSITYSYNANGNRTGILNARGQTTTNGYDASGRLVGTTYSDGTPAKSFTHDPAGRMTIAVDGTGSRTIGYDDDGRMTSVTHPAGGAFAYTYDPAGRLLQRAYPDTTRIGYTYDDDGRTTAQTTGGKTTTFGYDLAGNLTSTTYPTGTGAAEAFAYDPAGRLSATSSTRSGTPLASWQISRDPAGAATAAVTKHNGLDYTTTYTYDPAGRLASACPAAGSNGLCTSGVANLPGTTYTYDRVGNRATQATSSAHSAPRTTTYTYDAADQLTASTDPDGRTTYGYDADGNQTATTPPTGSQRSPVTRAFDAANRMTSQTMATGAPVTYAYDAFDNRATEQRGTDTATLAWDTNNNQPLLATRTEVGGATDYMHDPLGRVSSTSSAAGPTYLLHDWQDSVTDTADASGQPRGIASVDYDPFGNPTVDLALIGSTGIGFDSQMINADGGTYNLRARQYDPSTGRFLGRDPVTRGRVDPSVSGYVYTDNKPLDLDDRSGQTPQVPGAPNGRYMPGNTKAHNFALGMAADQQVAKYGARNVYAALDGRRGWRTKQWVLASGGGGHTGKGEPDLVARFVPTPRGPGYAVWDVKSAYGDGALDHQSQLAGYMRAIETETGRGTVYGEPVLTQFRYWPQERSMVTIFNASDWATYASPDAQENHSLHGMPTYDGIILYTKFQMNNHTRLINGWPSVKEYAAALAGTEKEILTCYPVLSAQSSAPLRAVGNARGADTSALEAMTRVAVQAVSVMDPDPFPLPPKPAPVPTIGREHSDGGGKGGKPKLSWKQGLTLAAVVTGLVLAPEVTAPVVARTAITRGIFALAA